MEAIRPVRVASRRGEGGNIVIEVALVLPLLLLVMGGILDLGILYWEKHVLTNASREGARAASRTAINGAAEKTQTQVMQVAQNYLDKFHLKNPDGSNVTLTKNFNFYYTWDLSGTPGKLTVELKNIQVNMMLLPNIMGFYGGSFSDSMSLSARTTMAAEWTTPPP